MSNKSLVLTIQSDRASVTDELVGNSTNAREQALTLANYFRKLASGYENASIDAHTSSAAPVAASQTVTCDQSDATADDKVTILGVDLTAKSSGATTNQFNIGSTDAELAANLAAAVNANTTLAKYVKASASAAIVTVECKVKGSIGNLLKATSVTVDSGTPFTLSDSGAFKNGAGGAEGDAISYSLGL